MYHAYESNPPAVTNQGCRAFLLDMEKMNRDMSTMIEQLQRQPSDPRTPSKLEEYTSLMYGLPIDDIRYWAF